MDKIDERKRQVPSVQRSTRRTRSRTRQRLSSAARSEASCKGGLAMARIRREAWPSSFRPLYDLIDSTYRCRLTQFLEFATETIGHDGLEPGDIDIELVRAYVTTELIGANAPALSSKLYGFIRCVEIALPHVTIPPEIWRQWNFISSRSYKPTGKRRPLPLCFQRSLAVPFADWPASHRERWMKSTGMVAANERTTRPNHSDPRRKYEMWQDESRAPAERLRRSTAESAEHVYSCFLFFVRSQNLGDEVTLSSVRAWLRACGERGVSNGSLGGYASRLKTVMIRCEPEGDWSFLTRLSFALLEAHQDKPKHSSVSAEELFAIGLDAMQEAIASGRRSMRTAARFRDGLLLCFLITVVVRSGNAAALRLGVNLILGKRPRIELSGADMKNGRAAEIPVPEEIAALIDLYMKLFHPALDVPDDQLWRCMSNGASSGRRLSQTRINAIVKALVKRATAKDVHVHLTRHAAAEFMAHRFAEQANLIRKLLLHEGETVARIYAGRAIAGGATRRLQEANIAVRNDTKRHRQA